MLFFRLPPGQAMALSHELDNGNNLKDNLFVDMNPDSRWGSVRYGGEVITAKVSKKGQLDILQNKMVFLYYRALVELLKEPSHVYNSYQLINS